MDQTLKDYLIQKGVHKMIALEMDEVVVALNSRITRLKRKGAEKPHILIELGKYRHLEQKSPHNFPEMSRMALDLAALILNFDDRLRLLELYGIVKFNNQTAEYEITDFGRRFYPDKNAPVQVQGQ